MTSSGCHRPFAAALLLFALVFAGLSWFLLRATEYQLVYALDDAYIHMAMARTLATHGVWGINANGFASASSSPLWTALLALAFRIAGTRVVVPLLLNLVAVPLSLLVLVAILRERRVHPAATTAIATAAVLFTPMAPLAWIGMEHSLNNLFVLLMLWTVVRLSSAEARANPLWFYVSVLLACATRIEGIFVVVGCGLALCAAQRPRTALIGTVTGAAPIVVFGIWNQAHGWFFLPASILMKQTILATERDTWPDALLQAVGRIAPPPAFLGAVGVAVLLLVVILRSGGRLRDQPCLTVFLSASMLHLLLARFGYLYRYESYLMLVGVVAIGMGAIEALTSSGAQRRDIRVVVNIAAVAALVIGAARAVEANVAVVTTAGHVFRQQRQVARFIDEYYREERVALNDIGAVSYYTQADVHDLGGLASLPVARARRQGRFDAAFINEWLDGAGVRTAIVYDAWFDGSRGFRRSWIPVATWVTDEGGAEEAAVSFYARDDHDARRLRASIDAFRRDLPSSVQILAAHLPDQAP